MTGPIRGARLAAEVKLQIVRAVAQAGDQGLTIDKACGVILLDSRRLRRWVAGRPVYALTVHDLVDRPAVAKISPHALTEDEKATIVAASEEPELVNERHRNLTHHLSRQGRVWCSESSTLRVLRSAGKVPIYQRRSKPKRLRPEVDDARPNQTWRFDATNVPTRTGLYHLIPVMDSCSRKILGRYFGPENTSASVQTAWDKALASEGLYAEDIDKLPVAFSDRGTQMTSRSTRQFFNDIGITQTFSRPRTPADNASCEAWMATIKCERLYHADTWELAPWEVEQMVDRFIEHYNFVRLHQGIGFVTPAERHDGRHTAIIEARKAGLDQARQLRKHEAMEGAGVGR